jgi:MFS family permease
MVGIGAFEFGNIAATLLILRATELLDPGRTHASAIQLATALYVLYNLAATLVSFPAGRAGDRVGTLRVLITGIALFAAAYAGFAFVGASIPVLAVCFVGAGLAIGCVETAEHAAVALLAPGDLRGSAFGLLAAVQSFGNLAASAIAGVVWTAFSATAALLYAAVCMTLSLALLFSRRG